MKKNFLLKVILCGAMMLFAFAMVFAGSPDNAGIRLGDKTFRLPDNVSAEDYEAGVIIMKLKPEYRFVLVTESNPAVQSVFNLLQSSTPQRIFPNAVTPEAAVNSWGAAYVDLSLIYQVRYQSDMNIVSAINKLLATGMFEYVEPNYIYRVNYTPNDPSYTNSGQYFIKKVQADLAWDIIKGDTNVVIGIVDTGTDWDHPDLINNIKYNYADPINGVDDDGDGYIDNYRGWDVSEGNNNPMVVGSNHGSHVSGCAAASTDNGVGVASPGFLCKFLPVKAAKDAATGTLDSGYPGIAYAADHGCKVINCSWGGAGGGSYGQDIINYATVNKNALVVVSAGNNNNEVVQYPAGYNYVMNVAATTSTDAKASFSTYGTWVTISAPGNAIYSTVYNNSYTSMSGTSMASPIAAGCAALVKAKFPSYNALQIKEQLRATADNIYGLSANSAYQGKLGSGRINVYKAVSTANAISVGMINIKTTDKNDDAFVVGDTLRISGDIVNYLGPVSNLVVTMSSTSTYVTILNNTVNVGALGTMGISNNASNPFTAIINPSAPANSKVVFKFTFTDGTYSASINYEVVVNVDYLNITVNDVQTSATSKSLMAYNDADLSTRVQGMGFMYRDSSVMFECGLLIGDGSSRVSDNVRVGGTGSVIDNDFQTNVVIKRTIPSAIGADFDATGKFRDNTSPSPLGLLVTHRELAWSTPGDRKYVIVQYSIKNNGSSTLSNLYAGLFADWDISANGATDKATVDKALRMGYVYKNAAGGFYGGIKLLTPGGFNNYSIDNGATDGSIAIYTSFNTAEKYTALSTPRDASGGANGADVSHVVSSGPFTVNAGDSVVVAFAILAGDDLPELQNGGIKAQLKYDSLFTGVSTLTPKSAFALSVMPNPANHNATFRFNLNKSDFTELALYDMAGQKVTTLISEKISEGNHEYKFDLSGLNAGIYFYKLNSGAATETGRFVLIR